MTQEEKAKAYEMALEAARKELGCDRKEYKVVEQVLKSIFPELRESEDEKIREEIIKTISWIVPDCQYAIVLPREQKDKWISWLEKQKDLMPPTHVDPCDASWHAYYQRGLNKGYELGLEAGKKEQKPVEVDELKIIKKHITEDSLSSDVNKRLKDCGWYVTDEKPVEWSEGDTLMCNAALELLRSHPNLMASHGINKSSVIRWLQSFRPQKQGFIDDICSKAGIAIPYLDGNQWCILKGDNIQAGVVGFGGTKEDALANFIKDVPIPQQWSEFDKGVLKDAICAADILGNDESFNKGNPNLGKAFRVAKDWLKSLPERFNLQPKQEWSEEDEKIITALTKALIGSDSAEKIMLFDGVTIEMVSDWLKSLRPQWKPTEEQMEALQRAIDACESEWAYQDDELRSLLNDLKKL